MKKIVAKLFIAVAFGVIVGEVVGMSTQYKSYEGLHYGTERVEISKEKFESESSDYSDRKAKHTFNKKNFLFFGGVAGSVLLIILMLPEVKSTKATTKATTAKKSH